jgi:hypothetical protein
MSLKSKLKKGGFTTWKKIVQQKGIPVGVLNGKSVDVRYYDLENVSPSAELAKYCELQGIPYNEILVGNNNIEDLTKALVEVGYVHTTRIISHDSGKRK